MMTGYNGIRILPLLAHRAIDWISPIFLNMVRGRIAMTIETGEKLDWVEAHSSDQRWRRIFNETKSICMDGGLSMTLLIAVLAVAASSSQVDALFRKISDELNREVVISD